jgi:hypothetical protein
MTYSHRPLRSHRSLRGAALLAWGALLLIACPGDDGPAQADTGSTSTSTSTSTGPELTTNGPPPGTTVEASSSGIDLDTTMGSTATASTSTSGETGMGDVTTSEASSGSSDSSSSSSSSDSGFETGTGEQGYGDCFNNPVEDVCLTGESCIDDAGMPPGVGVCALQECGGAGECPSPPPGGSASPACMDVTGDMVDECVLHCTDADCPTGMACFADFVCVWGTEGLGPGDFSCVDEDLGNATGAAVATGSTGGQGNDFTPGCVMSNAADVAFVWTALIGGTYTFDTIGSSYDTVLYAREDCVGATLACNDDTVETQSEIVLDLAAGQSVMLVVDGWNNSTGNYVLNIN